MPKPQWAADVTIINQGHGTVEELRIRKHGVIVARERQIFEDGQIKQCSSSQFRISRTEAYYRIRNSRAHARKFHPASPFPYQGGRFIVVGT